VNNCVNRKEIAMFGISRLQSSFQQQQCYFGAFMRE